MKGKVNLIFTVFLVMVLTGCGGPSVNVGTVPGDASGFNLVVLQAEGEYIIDGVVFNDIDGNDLMDTCEPGIGGVEVQLLTSEDVLLDSSTTNSGGYYAFAVTAAGDYNIMEIDPAGYTSAINSVHLLDLMESSTVNFADQTLEPSYSICGKVYNDTDGSGTMDSAESGMGGITAALTGNGDAVTDADGIYAFAVTASGTYTVGVIEPDGYLSTTPNPANVLIADSDGVQDFGLRAYMDVPVDVKPCSEVNPVNLRSKGVLPVAILGTGELDVTDIAPETISLNGIYPLRWSIGDVCGDEECGEKELPRDGYPDLLLKFRTQEIAAALMALYPDLSRGDIVTLEVEGELYDMTALEPDPSVRILIVQVPKNKGYH